VTDFALTVTGDEDKTVTGKIGSGAAHIELSTSNGDLHIKKGSAVPVAPPAAPTATNPPTSPKAPHLKSAAPLPQQPVTQ
jgi:hypothetical protein